MFVKNIWSCMLTNLVVVENKTINVLICWSYMVKVGNRYNSMYI